MNLLVSWLWQGSFVALAAAVIVRACPRLTPATRYGLWWAALLMVGIVPMVAPALAFLHSATAPATHAGPVVFRTNASGMALSFALPLPPLWLLRAVLAAWLALVLLRLAQIVHSMAAMSRLKRDSQPLDSGWENGLVLWQAARGVGRRCELRVSDRTPGACVVGLRRPAILLPVALLHALSNQEIDQIVLHEHAHVVRYDDWSRLAQCLLAAVVGVHPAAWVINRRIDLEREAACDDRVIARTRAARAYAACLAHIAAVQFAGSAREPIVVPAAARSRSMLRARIVRLVDGDAPATMRLGWASAAFGLAALSTVMIAAGLVPPPITFTTRATAVLGALPTVRVPWHAALPAKQAWEASSTAAAVEIARPSLLNATEAAPPSADHAGNVAATDPGPALVAPTSQEAAMPAPPLASHAIGADLLPVSLEPLPARPTAPQPTARALSLPDGSAFATFGNHAAHAGVALGTHLQEMGGNLGGWFARVARGVSPP